MNNYIYFKGVKIELTPKQVEQFKTALGLKVPERKLADIASGDTFKIGNHELIVLEHFADTTAVIRKDLLDKRMRFGYSNNYDGSDVDFECNKFADEIASIVGKENIVEHTVDLTSDDGLKDYGTIRRYASLLTTDLYRRYVEILDAYNPNEYWWLATAHSTKSHGSNTLVQCICALGYIDHMANSFNDFGVRPFCILKSNIFVS